MNQLTIDHVTFSSKGGAGGVAASLSAKLNEVGAISRLITVTDGDIRNVGLRNLRLTAEAILDYYLVRKSTKNPLFSLMRGSSRPSTLKALKVPSEILHLHWIPGVVSLEQVVRISRNYEKTVWTLHDMYPITGGCHHALNCTQYESSCRSCPQVRRAFKRLVESQFAKKMSLMKQVNGLEIVVPSRWLQSKSEKSAALDSARIWHIPNPIDTNVFIPKIRTRPFDQHLVIGCSATNLLDPLKGVLSLVDELVAFQHRFPEVRITLIAIGGGILPPSSIRVVQTGLLANPLDVRHVLQGLDVFVSLSRAENFPISLLEAQSCGVPVICLDSGGMSEIFTSGTSGFILRHVEQLASTLHNFYLLNERIGEMQLLARQNIVENYSLDLIARKYLEVYTSSKNN